MKAILILLICGATVLHADLAINWDMTIAEYESINNDRNPKASEVLSTYISALGEGFRWANAHLESIGAQQMFCVPEKLSLNEANYRQILADQIRGIEKMQSVNVAEMKKHSLVGAKLLAGLVRTFPCKATK